ncbi:hypothetical protein [Bradyrhizobium cajani]|uniref:hypothetical protein n=1 Tax=Bradyrhizobium cajani TaxID=1928661 RepID=UPI001FE31192|nr:hypothetical protein [Bradyrhizobium cajani]MCP3368458.1 hypothetical protein [Bradyrhizobium cajani]
MLSRAHAIRCISLQIVLLRRASIAVINDTAVFDALRLDVGSGDRVATGLIGTREAIVRDGLFIDPLSIGYCPHEWIDGSGYVDPELARKFSYSLAF